VVSIVPQLPFLAVRFMAKNVVSKGDECGLPYSLFCSLPVMCRQCTRKQSPIGHVQVSLITM